jgi:DNA repair protein RecO (recombination protein O)
MEKFTTEGVVINAIPFRNYDCILTVFTPDDGLAKFFFRGAYSKKKGSGSGTTTPLSVVEITYTKGRGDLYICVETTVLNHNLALRNCLATLEAAGDMLQTISATQQPGKSAPELYRLLLMYLNKLPQATSPQAITSSFRLKLLRYEGLLSLLSHCCMCSEILHDTWVHGGEAYCRSHTAQEALFLTKEERGLVELLAFGRDFPTLAGISLQESLSRKILRLFDESVAT